MRQSTRSGTLPDVTVSSSTRRLVERTSRRIAHGTRGRAIADAVLLGAAASGLAFVAAITIVPSAPPAVVALLAGGVVFGAATIAVLRRWSAARAVAAFEREQTRLDNLLVTAHEALQGRAVHPIVAEELYAQAAARLEGVDWARWYRDVWTRVALALFVAAAAVVVIGRGVPVANRGADGDRPTPRPTTAAAAAALRVIVVPPSYSRRPPLTLDDPSSVEVLEGSRVRFEIAANGRAELVEPGRVAQAFARDGSRAWLESVVRESRVFLVRVAGAPDRLLQLRVLPDRPPTIVIDRPGRDLLFAAPTGEVPIAIRARDDLRIAALSLRYTRIAGSGETFTFEEGEIPLRTTTRSDGAEAAATGTLTLDRLQLVEGDSIVYRAIARDDKPGSDPVASDSFLIEIGKPGEAAASGVDLPQDRDRQALSQQMVIMKTERLQAARSTWSADALLEQSRLLAVEQRMVRAEFLFMTGGEVADEVEEAEHSDELAQGRQANRGQSELLAAIREMSRAEARLNGGDTVQALVFERAALVALQRAFDRRRYFLRTLPERTRVDPGRRLSGDLASARPSALAPAILQDDRDTEVLRMLIRELADAIRTRRAVDPALAARLLAAAPDATGMQRRVLEMTSSEQPEGERLRAASAAEQELLAMLRARLGIVPPTSIERDRWRGHVNERLLTSPERPR